MNILNKGFTLSPRERVTLWERSRLLYISSVLIHRERELKWDNLPLPATRCRARCDGERFALKLIAEVKVTEAVDSTLWTLPLNLNGDRAASLIESPDLEAEPVLLGG